MKEWDLGGVSVCLTCFKVDNSKCKRSHCAQTTSHTYQDRQRKGAALGQRRHDGVEAVARTARYHKRDAATAATAAAATAAVAAVGGATPRAAGRRRRSGV
jgi:hypothetical protein